MGVPAHSRHVQGGPGGLPSESMVGLHLAEPSQMSLTDKYVLSELGSPGKSGSFFYYSQDYRFIIKTIKRTEHVFLRRILPQYYDHVRRYPNTLVSRFFGLHRVKLPQGKKIPFIVMGNIFPPNVDVHEVYDLKVQPPSDLHSSLTFDRDPSTGERQVKRPFRRIRMLYGRT